MCSDDLTNLTFAQLAAAVDAGRVTRDAANAEWQRRKREREAAAVKQAADYAAREAAEREAQRRAQIPRATEILWQGTRVPARHAGKIILRTNAAGPWAKAYRQVSARCDDGSIVVLLGRRGTGKTQLAACVLRDYVERVAEIREYVPTFDTVAKYVRLPDLTREIRGTYSRDADESEETVCDRYANLGLLAVDEVNEVGGTDFELRTLTGLVDYRYAALRTTILISNLTREGFAEVIGASIVSRLNEVGLVIECEWPSFRRQENRA